MVVDGPPNNPQPEDIQSRLQHAISAGAPNRDMLIEAVREISELRAKDRQHHANWWYLACHPEHVGEVVGEIIYGQQHERDHCGHIIPASINAS